MVTPERVTCAGLEIVTTLPTPPPSRIVVLAPEPRIFRLTPMLKCSLYVAAATLIESPEAAKEMAWPTVLQAVVGDVQSLLLLPLTPFTYHVVVANAAEPRARNTAENRTQLSSFSFMIFSSSSRQLRRANFVDSRDDATRAANCNMRLGATEIASIKAPQEEGKN